MSYAAYGYGRDGIYEGSVAAYGLGIIQIAVVAVIVKIASIVYREIRNLLIKPENRILEVEAVPRSIFVEELRQDKVQQANRLFSIPIQDRVQEIEMENRNKEILNNLPLDTYEEDRSITITEEDRTCTIKEESRNMQVKKEGEDQ